MVHHEAFVETSNNPLVAWLAAAGVGHVILFSKFYVHSLPKSCGFKLRMRLKSGHFLVNIISQRSETSLGLGWKTTASFQLLLFLLEVGIVVGKEGGWFMVSCLEPQYLVGNHIFDGANPLCVHTNVGSN